MRAWRSKTGRSLAASVDRKCSPLLGHFPACISAGITREFSAMNFWTQRVSKSPNVHHLARRSATSAVAIATTTVHVALVALLSLVCLDDAIAATRTQHAARRAGAVRAGIHAVVALLAIGLYDAVAAVRTKLAVRRAAAVGASILAIAIVASL